MAQPAAGGGGGWRPTAGGIATPASGTAVGSSASCRGRFYEAVSPQPKEIVMVKVERHSEMGVWVQLLEYNGKVAMIAVEAISRVSCSQKVSKRVLAKGRNVVCTVVKSDPKTGNFDLSKSEVPPEAAAAKEETFARAKIVHGVMWYTASNNNIEVEELCSKVSWPLFKNHRDAFEVLKRHVLGEYNLWEELDFSQPGRDLSGLASKLKAEIVAEMRRRLDQMMVKLRAKCEVSCFEYGGIDAVREALERGSSASTSDCLLRIRLIAHPFFVVDCSCRRRCDGVQALDKALELIEKSIKSAGGYFRLRSHPEYSDWELESEEEDDDESDEDDLEPEEWVLEDALEVPAAGGCHYLQEDADGAS